MRTNRVPSRILPVFPCLKAYEQSTWSYIPRKTEQQTKCSHHWPWKFQQQICLCQALMTVRSLEVQNDNNQGKITIMHFEKAKTKIKGGWGESRQSHLKLNYFQQRWYLLTNSSSPCTTEWALPDFSHSKHLFSASTREKERLSLGNSR